MVGDDDAHAGRVDMGDLLDGGRAGIDGDEQAHALLAELVDGGNMQAVALRQAVGDIIKAVRAQRAQRVDQDNGGGHAVDVVVAVNGDAFALCDGIAEDRDGFRQIAQRSGIEQTVHGGVEVCGSVFCGPDAAGVQNRAQKRGQSGALCERPAALPVAFGYQKSFFLHFYVNPNRIDTFHYSKLRQ